MNKANFFVYHNNLHNNQYKYRNIKKNHFNTIIDLII